MHSALSPGFLAGLAATFLLASGALAADRPNPMQPSQTWEDIRTDIVGEREIHDGSAVLSLDAPYRAHDAAVVPVEIRSNGSEPRIEKLTLIVDENPAPVAAEFEIGPAMGQLEIATRVRVNAYSNIRAIAETADGRLFMVGRHVKASGGCSAPAMKDADAALAAMGQMKLRVFDAEAAMSMPRREAQVMLRHPNYSGLQMNQLTRHFIPAHFVDRLEVRLGDDLVFRMSAGISISEDPSFRFGYDDTGAQVFHVRATDTDGNVFEADFPAAGGGS